MGARSRNFSLATTPRPLLVPTEPPTGWVTGYFTRALSGQFLEMIHVHVLSNSIMRGDIYFRFGTTYRSHFKDQESKKGPIGCPETSVRNYHYPLRNNSEERSYHRCFYLKMSTH
jgi:hypothetical protein